MAEEAERVVMRQQGQPDRPFWPNSAAKDVLFGITGNKAGVLKNTESGFEFGGSSQVPAGVYQLVPPEAPSFDLHEMIEDLQLYKEVPARMKHRCRAMLPKQTWYQRIFHEPGQDQAKKGR